MKWILFLPIFSIFVIDSAFAQKKELVKDYASIWSNWIEYRDYKTAQRQCTMWLATADKTAQIEGHKCLVNVVMGQAKSEMVAVEDDQGVATLMPGYEKKQIKKALDHLNKALILAPGDPSLHQGRLNLLLAGHQYEDLPTYLEKSLKKYQDTKFLEASLDYGHELFRYGQYKVSIEYFLVLRKYYPEDYRVYANLGSAYSQIGDNTTAIAFTMKAVGMNPKNALNNWNLARLFELTHQLEKADKYYEIALSLDHPYKHQELYGCFYAEFIQNKLKNKRRACAMYKNHCPDRYSDNCH